jgi:hypothetical protein
MKSLFVVFVLTSILGLRQTSALAQSEQSTGARKVVRQVVPTFSAPSEVVSDKRCPRQFSFLVSCCEPAPVYNSYSVFCVSPVINIFGNPVPKGNCFSHVRR